MRILLLTLMCVGLFLFGGNSFAQTQPDPVNDINMRFCNGEKKLSFETETQEEKEICYIFANNSSEDKTLSIEFVDATITNDTSQHEACQGSTKIQRFGQFVAEQTASFLVPANSMIQRTTTIKFPNGHAGGEIMGCVAYYIDQGTDPNSPISIRIRKGHIIKTIVHGEVEREVVITPPTDNSTANNPKTKPEKKSIPGYNKKGGPKGPFYVPVKKENIIGTHINESGDLVIEVGITNSGSIPEEVYITGTVTDMFGEQKSFETTIQKVLPGKTNTIIYTIPEEELPIYKGSFDLDIQVHYSADVDERIKGDFPPQTLSHTEDFMILPDQDLVNIGAIILMAILILLIRIIVKRKRKRKKKLLLAAAKRRKKQAAKRATKTVKKTTATKTTRKTTSTKTTKKTSSSKKPTTKKAAPKKK